MNNLWIFGRRYESRSEYIIIIENRRTYSKGRYFRPIREKVLYVYVILKATKKRQNSMQIPNKISAVYYESSVVEITVWKLFARFKAKTFYLEN